jgi:hypothetical protein
MEPAFDLDLDRDFEPSCDLEADLDRDLERSLDGDRECDLDSAVDLDPNLERDHDSDPLNSFLVDDCDGDLLGDLDACEP